MRQDCRRHCLGSRVINVVIICVYGYETYYGLFLRHRRPRLANTQYSLTPSFQRSRNKLFYGTEGPWLAVWRSGRVVGRINEVVQRRARLVMGWVTVIWRV